MRPVLAGPWTDGGEPGTPLQAAPVGTDRLRRVLAAQREIAAAGDDHALVLRVVCEELLGLTAAESAVVLLLEGRSLVARAWAGELPNLGELRLDIGGTFSGRVLRDGTSAIVGDYASDPRTTGVDTPISSLLIVPLRHRGESLGQIQLASRARDAFDDDDLALVELLSVYVALGLARAAEADALRRLGTVFDKATVGIARWDERGTILEANAALERMLGYGPGELRDVGLRELTHPDDLADTLELATGLTRDRRETFLLEKRFLRKDGSALWAQTTAVRDGVDADGRPLGISLIEDIGERKHAELALRRSEERLGLIVETQTMVAAAEAGLADVMELIVERAQLLTAADGAVLSLIDGEDLVVVAASGVCEAWTGQRRSVERSAAGHAIETARSFVSTRADDDPWLNRELVERLGEQSHICVPLFHGDRALGALDVTRVVETAFDAEDQRALELLCVVLSSAVSRAAEAEAKREQLEALGRFRAIYERAPLGIMLVALDGTIVDANPAWVEKLGYSAEELRALESVDELIHPDDLAETRRRRQELMGAGRGTGFQVERRYLCRNGSVIWGESSSEYIYSPDGSPAFIFVMVQDVTGRKATEDQLRQAQKVEAIGQLSAGIAHDFNNLLMGVLGYAGFLRAQTVAGTQTDDYLQRIEETAKRAARLTQQLLAFGRQQALQPQEMDLNEHVRDAVSMLGRVLGEHIEIRVDLARDLPPLRADPTQVHQVLLNLALNARDAMPDGGELLVTTRAVAADDASVPPEVELAGAGCLVLAVRDTGSGMSEEVRARIFDPFFTTKPVGAGSGLGLASVYGIVKQSGGEIAVESEVGVGTTFTIHLPALPAS